MATRIHRPVPRHQRQHRTRVSTARPKTDSAGRGLESPDLVRVAFTVGWRSITAVCWMLDQELAVGAGLLAFVSERLPRARPQPAPARAPEIVSVSRQPHNEVAPNTDKDPAVLALPGRLLPGQTGERPLVIENTHQSRTRTVTFAASDLLAVSSARVGAARIAAQCLRFEPESLLIPPRSKGRVLVHVTVPHDTPTGTYVGALQSPGLPHTLVRVNVA